jgi:hypothetical protein
MFVLVPAMSFAGLSLDKRETESIQPYALNPVLDLPLFGGLYAMTKHAGGMLKETRAVPLDMSKVDSRDVSAFDRWAVGFHSPLLSGVSSGLAWSQFLIPVAVNAVDTWRGKQPWYGALTDAVILQEALMISSSLSSYAKSFPIHSTPLTYDSRVSEKEKMIPQNVSSFFSNHTATAFTTAVFTGYTYQLRHPGSKTVPWVWGTSLGLAAGVGGLRILAGKHFPTDVVAGAAVGALSGYLVPRMHLRRRNAPMRAHARAVPEESRTFSEEEGKTDEGNLDVTVGVTFPAGTKTPVPTLNVAF